MILPLVTFIEILSFVSRPISHSVRLFANMLAGHITLKVFAGFITNRSHDTRSMTRSAVLPITGCVSTLRETAPITSKAEAAARFFTRRSFTTPAALAGVPALAVPCGFSAAGLPLSLQIIGRRFEDATVLRVGHAYEQATDWHRRRPGGAP